MSGLRCVTLHVGIVPRTFHRTHGHGEVFIHFNVFYCVLRTGHCAGQIAGSIAKKVPLGENFDLRVGSDANGHLPGSDPKFKVSGR